jgi:hypothetical protein
MSAQSPSHLLLNPSPVVLQPSNSCSVMPVLAQCKSQLQSQVSDMKLALARQWPLSGRGFSENAENDGPVELEHSPASR